MDEIKFYHVEDPFGYFSNYSEHSIFLEGESWKTCEHYYQAQKFEDPNIQKVIREAITPKEASKVGRNQPEDIRNNWNEIKDEIMEKAIRAKVTQHEEIKEKLIETKDAVIIEDSPTDFYWGYGDDGNGLNKLGGIWMKVRNELFNQK